MTKKEIAGRILQHTRNLGLQSQPQAYPVAETGTEHELAFFAKSRGVHRVDVVVEHNNLLQSMSDNTASPQPPPPSQLPVTKAQLIVKLKSLIDRVRIELHAASFGPILTGVSTGITAIAGAGAAIFSNVSGVVTTLLAGGSGTTGIIAGTKDSITSYIWLRADLLGRLKGIEDDLDACPENDQTQLVDIQSRMKQFLDYLDQQEKSQQPQKN